jgi:Polysaccharide lyase
MGTTRASDNPMQPSTRRHPSLLGPLRFLTWAALVLIAVIPLASATPVALSPDLTVSFDAEPAYSEFAPSGIWPGFTCDGSMQFVQSPSEAYVRDPVVRRHGTYSARVHARSDGYHGYGRDCTRLRTQALVDDSVANEKQGSEGWYAFSIRLPTSFPTLRGWATVWEFAADGATHPAYGMLPFDITDDSLSVIFHTGLTPNPGSPIFDPAYNASERVLGPGAPRSFTKGVWHDIYFHVVWSAGRQGDVTPVFTLWHREEGGAWAKLYSNQPNSGALIQRSVHPTLMYNTQYGTPGESGTNGLHYGNIGLYRPAPGPTVDFWLDGFRRRQNEAAILAEFPTSAPPAVSPTNVSRPVLSGSAAAGQTLTTSTGTWSGTAPITYTYQWRRCDSAGNNCSDLAGATGQSYLIASGDVGSKLYALVTARNAAGSASMRTYLSATVMP